MDTILKDVNGKYISPLIQSSTVYDADTQITIKDDIDDLKYVNNDNGEITVTVYNGCIPYIRDGNTYVRDANNKEVLYYNDYIYHSYQRMRIQSDYITKTPPIKGDLIVFEDGKASSDSIGYRGNISNAIYKNITVNDRCHFRACGDNCSLSFYNCNFSVDGEASFYCDGNNASLYFYNCNFPNVSSLECYCSVDNYQEVSKISLINCTFDKKIELEYFYASYIDLTGTVFKQYVYRPYYFNNTYNNLLNFINQECFIFDYTPINGEIKNNVKVSNHGNNIGGDYYFYMYISDDTYSAKIITDDNLLGYTKYRHVSIYATDDSPCSIIGSNMSNFFKNGYNNYIEEFNTNLTSFADITEQFSGSLNKKSVETIFNMLGDFTDTNYSYYHSNKTTGTLTLNRSTLIYITDEMLALATTKGWTFVPSLQSVENFYDSYYEGYEEYKKSIKHNRIGGTHVYLDGSIKLHNDNDTNYATGKVDTAYDCLAPEDTGSTIMTIYYGNNYLNSNFPINVTSYLNAQTKLKHLVWKDNYVFDNGNNQSILAPLEYVDFSNIDFTNYNSKTDYSVSNYRIFKSTALTRLYMWKNNGINLNFSCNPLDYISIKYLLTNSLLDLSSTTSKTVVFSKTSYDIIKKNELESEFAKLNWNIAYVEDPTKDYTF